MRRVELNSRGPVFGTLLLGAVLSAPYTCIGASVQCVHFWINSSGAWIPSGRPVGIDVGKSPFGDRGGYQCTANLDRSDDARYLYIGEVGDAAFVRYDGKEAAIVGRHGLEGPEDTSPVYLRWFPFVLPLSQFPTSERTVQFRLQYVDLFPSQSGLRTGVPTIETKLGVIRRLVLDFPALLYNAVQIAFLAFLTVGFLFPSPVPWKTRGVLAIGSFAAAMVILQLTAIPRSLFNPTVSHWLNQTIQMFAVPAWAGCLLVFFSVRPGFPIRHVLHAYSLAFLIGFAIHQLFGKGTEPYSFGIFMLVFAGLPLIIFGIAILKGLLKPSDSTAKYTFFPVFLILAGVAFFIDIFNYLALNGRHYYLTHFFVFPPLFMWLKLRFEERQQRFRLAAIAQASHDIRSPLSALTMVTTRLGEVESPEAGVLRSAVERITHIVKDLDGELRFEERSRAEHLVSLLDAVVTEKCIEKPGAAIRLEVEGSAEEAFAQVEIGAFQRTVSNLVNNAVEAAPFGSPVVVKISADADRVRVEVMDRGPGFPKEVLAVKGSAPLSIGKQGGRGLGLHRAFEDSRRWAAKLELRNREDGGAVAGIEMNRAPTPLCLARSSFVRGEGCTLVTKDSVRETEWRSSLSRWGAPRELTVIRSIHELQSCIPVQTLRGRHSGSFFIEVESGEEIRTCGAILTGAKVSNVTFAVPSLTFELVQAATGIGASIFRRGALHCHEFWTRPGRTILIDDDELIRDTWAQEADLWDADFHSFETFEQALPMLRRVPRDDTFVFIDLYLSSHRDGNDVARSLLEMGFKRVFITSGAFRTLLGTKFAAPLRDKYPPW